MICGGTTSPVRHGHIYESSLEALNSVGNTVFFCENKPVPGKCWQPHIFAARGVLSVIVLTEADSADNSTLVGVSLLSAGRYVCLLKLTRITTTRQKCLVLIGD